MRYAAFTSIIIIIYYYYYYYLNPRKNEGKKKIQK